ncbi:hypothetical protein ACIQF6_21290 [Kitasatospora sp. NPDC092948]|uniref:hypothetical protein n=1 Tax=Kitasatospora sp. NPDC092948 TaxID=3364088 RepID=UPI0037FBABD5
MELSQILGPWPRPAGGPSVASPRRRPPACAHGPTDSPLDSPTDSADRPDVGRPAAPPRRHGRAPNVRPIQLRARPGARPEHAPHPPAPPLTRPGSAP